MTNKLKEITLEKTRNIIRDMKNTNTIGFDRISARIIKLSGEISSILITHAINVSIREAKFPSSMKIVKGDTNPEADEIEDESGRIQTD